MEVKIEAKFYKICIEMKSEAKFYVIITISPRFIIYKPINWPLKMFFFKPMVNISTDASLEGKTVLLVGEGPLKVALHCLIERNGMFVQSSHSNSNSLQSQVGF